MELNFPRAPKPIQKRPLWKSAAVALISLIIVVVVFFLWTHPSISCDLRGGKWFYPIDQPEGWMDPNGMCVYIYADAGKPCKEDSDCQGFCQLKKFGRTERVCSHDSLVNSGGNFSGEWEYAP